MTDPIPDGPAAAVLLGRLLETSIGAIGRVRGPRPIHTTGLLLTGRLDWHRRTAARSGIAWIDERQQGVTSVVARLSRGAALPAVLPDVIGLAVRAGTIGADVDLLLSSTGIGVPGRFLLHPRWTPTRAFLSTLMPYRGASGPVLIGARSVTPAMPARMEAVRDALTREPWRLELVFATPRGLWHRFAELELVPAPGQVDGPTPRFDPVLRAPHGAGTYGWTRALREPAYATARLTRRRPMEPSGSTHTVRSMTDASNDDGSKSKNDPITGNPEGLPDLGGEDPKTKQPLVGDQSVEPEGDQA